jgi:hypothetical protein
MASTLPNSREWGQSKLRNGSDGPEILHYTEALEGTVLLLFHTVHCMQSAPRQQDNLFATTSLMPTPKAAFAWEIMLCPEQTQNGLAIC